MEVEKVTYDSQYPYIVKDSWGGMICLTKKDLIELKKSINKVLKE